jgi:hypothetical protein
MGGLADGKMFQLVKPTLAEAGILVMDDELRQSYKIGEKTTLSLPELAITHHRICVCISPKEHIPKVAVATAELQSMLWHALGHYDFKGQHPRTDTEELQRRYLRFALAWLLLMNAEVEVHVDSHGRPKLSGQFSKRFHFGDLLIKHNTFRIGLGKHVGAAEHWLDIHYTQLQNRAQLRALFHDTGSSGTPYQKALIRLGSSRLTKPLIDLSGVEGMER